jgi:hypothetical protein
MDQLGSVGSKKAKNRDLEEDLEKAASNAG